MLARILIDRRPDHPLMGHPCRLASLRKESTLVRLSANVTLTVSSRRTSRSGRRQEVGWWYLAGTVNPSRHQRRRVNWSRAVRAEIYFTVA